MKTTLKRTRRFIDDVGGRIIDFMLTTVDWLTYAASRLIRGPFSGWIAFMLTWSAVGWAVFALGHYLFRNYNEAAFFAGLTGWALGILALHLLGSYKWALEQYEALDEDYENEVRARQNAGKAATMLGTANKELSKKLAESFVRAGRLNAQLNDLTPEVEHLTTENRRLLRQRDTARALLRAHDEGMAHAAAPGTSLQGILAGSDIADYYARTRKINRNTGKNIVTGIPVTVESFDSETGILTGSIPEEAMKQIESGRITGVSVDQDGMGQIDAVQESMDRRAR